MLAYREYGSGDDVPTERLSQEKYVYAVCPQLEILEISGILLENLIVS